MEDRVLFCLVSGTPEPFEVTTSGSSSISNLQELIHDKAYLHIGFMRLALWKLNEPLAIEPREVFLKCALDLSSQPSQRAVYLAPSRKVWSCFPEQPSVYHVCIIAQQVQPVTISLIFSGGLLSDSRKRPHSPDSRERRRKRQNLGSCPWLSELHSQVWGREDQRKKLFRKVTVTKGHYEELQRQCEELRKRGADKREFLPIKLGILRDYNPPTLIDASGQPVEGQEPEDDTSSNPVEGQESEEELDSLFPATFEYLDLSPLELENQHRLRERLPLPLLVREDYSIITKLLDDPRQNKNRFGHLSGQPGIGKTAYIHYKIIEYMIEGRPFLYQSMLGEVYSISENVEVIDDGWRPDAPVVALVDADSNNFVLQPCVRHDDISVITASPPDPIHMKSVKQRDPARRPTQFMADLWTREELFLTGIFLGPLDPDFERLIRSTAYFGLNPRQCFAASTSELSMVRCRNALMADIVEASQSLDMGYLVHQTRTTSGISHSIFQLRPKDENRFLDEALVEPVSMWSLTSYLDEYEKNKAGGACDFYERLAGKNSCSGQLRLL